jgi:hypothetical protein
VEEFPSAKRDKFFLMTQSSANCFCFSTSVAISAHDDDGGDEGEKREPENSHRQQASRRRTLNALRQQTV